MICRRGRRGVDDVSSLQFDLGSSTETLAT